MFAVLSAILPIFLVAGIGYFLRRKFVLDSKTLSTLNIYFLMPVLVFSSLSGERITWDVYGRYLAATVLMLAVMWGVLAFAARLHGIRGDMHGAFMMTMFMNLGNFGLPVSKFAFGDTGLALAVIVMVSGMFFQNSLAIFFAHQNSKGLGRAFLEIFRYPLLYAFILAVVAQQLEWRPPDVIDRAIDISAGAAIPIQLLILGMCIAETQLQTSSRVFSATGIRLVGGPIAGALIVWLLGMEGLAAQVFVLQMSGPVAVGMAVYGVQFDVKPGYLASVVTWTFLLSLFSVSVVLFALLRLY